MARRTFFSFHYEADVWRAANVRNVGKVEATSPAGFTDASIWEEAKSKGEAALKKLISDALVGTSVTAVLIGEKTSTRDWVTYEIEQSIARGNGLIGVHIEGIRDQYGNTGIRGAVPNALRSAGATVYTWDRDKFGDWVEAAAKAAGK